MDLYAWIGEDETGEAGIKMILAPGGYGIPAVFATRRVAELPLVLDQIQQNANVLNRPMRLVRVVEAEALRTLTPNPQG